MPTILETLLPTKSIDVVAVFDQNFNQVFPRARSLKAMVKPVAKVMEHPIESGAIITDHRILLPIEIELSMILASIDYIDTYRSIQQFYLNATLLIVQTRSGIYRNQLLSSISNEEDPDQYDALKVALNFKQVQIVTAQYSIIPRNKRNATTVDRGTQLPTKEIGQPSILGENIAPSFK